MQTDLLPLLYESGLPEKEARIYLALLERGQATVAQIAKASGLKRSIIYIALESLIKRGLVTTLPQKKVHTFAAGDPALLASRLQATAKNFTEMLPYLQSLSQKSTRRPKISYYDQQEAIWNVYKDMAQAREVSVITSYVRFMNFMPEEMEQWLRQCERGVYTGKKLRHLVPDSLEERVIAKRLIQSGQEVRIAKLTSDHSMDFIITHNKLAVSLIGEKPFMNVIESPQLAHSMQAIFELLWDTALPPRA